MVNNQIFIDNYTPVNNKFLNIITCTYPRKHRLKYLSHLKNLLSHQHNVRWFVTDDNDTIDNELKNFLPKFAIYNYIGPSKDKGHLQRNLSLEYIYDNKLQGIIYNADDDNEYDFRIFNEIRKTKLFSMFPVGGDLKGLHGGPEGPIVNKKNRLVNWNSHWSARKYAIDMAGFAFDSSLLYKLQKPFWSFKNLGGESEFIDKIINSVEDIEFLCDRCTKTYAFHNALVPKIEGK